MESRRNLFCHPFLSHKQFRSDCNGFLFSLTSEGFCRFKIHFSQNGLKVCIYRSILLQEIAVFSSRSQVHKKEKVWAVWACGRANLCHLNVWLLLSRVMYVQRWCRWRVWKFLWVHLKSQFNMTTGLESNHHLLSDSQRHDVENLTPPVHVQPRMDFFFNEVGEISYPAEKKKVLKRKIFTYSWTLGFFHWGRRRRCALKNFKVVSWTVLLEKTIEEANYYSKHKAKNHFMSHSTKSC